MTTMSDVLSDWSLLKLFWGGQALLAGASTLWILLRGNFWDKTQSHRDPDDPVGWFQFRKRPTFDYMIGVGWTGWLLYKTTTSYTLGWEVGTRLPNLLEKVATPTTVSTNTTCTVLASTMLFVHMTRRFLECTRISIFSQRQVNGIIGAVLDHLYVIGAGLSVLAEAPSLAHHEPWFELSALMNWRVPVSLLMYIWASGVQHNCFKVFARLRRNRAGHIVTTGYKIPKGGWFDSVSSPHYFAEVCIYSSIGLVLGCDSTTWWLLTLYVLENQFYRALSTHRFYKKKFEDYPKDRKIMVPFLL